MKLPLLGPALQATLQEPSAPDPDLPAPVFQVWSCQRRTTTTAFLLKLRLTHPHSRAHTRTTPFSSRAAHTSSSRKAHTSHASSIHTRSICPLRTHGRACMRSKQPATPEDQYYQHVTIVPAIFDKLQSVQSCHQIPFLLLKSRSAWGYSGRRRGRRRRRKKNEEENKTGQA